ncbi:MAG: restriction endonuclease subunit S [Clostridium sp.]|nr:restriction endonuclease subunit S [Clostridium sp.]
MKIYRFYLYIFSIINDNLQQQALTLYKHFFIETNNSTQTICKAEDYFDISIGKTPPRKETQWFSNNPADIVWVSISDMGNCGTYISDSSEYLTQEAVERYNIKIVPNNTVLLSFKLTVGRVAIANGNLTTNEAIAHFKTTNEAIVEYLYCYLTLFDYSSLGSTSSIATAVNSKIIKTMPFIMPAPKELAQFHEITTPMFRQIKANQTENDILKTIRDSLLPRLMSGEIDVSSVQL